MTLAPRALLPSLAVFIISSACVVDLEVLETQQLESARDMPGDEVPLDEEPEMSVDMPAEDMPPDAADMAPFVPPDINLSVSALSRQHSCAVRGDGTLWCWGTNSEGAEAEILAPGPDIIRAPQQIGQDTDWISVEARETTTCALKRDRTLWCWGKNGRGELGQGDLERRKAPSRVELRDDVVDFSVGNQFVCAVLADGRMNCWGANDENQLGRGFESPQPNTTPLTVGDDLDWFAVASGQGHTCGLRAPGTVWCWGRDTQDQAGGDAMEERVRVPEQVGEHDDYVDIAAGISHSCGIRGNGQLWCWGTNLQGAMGVGPDARFVTAEPVVVDPRSIYDQISADWFSTCARTREGRVWCSGRNIEGQLGMGGLENSFEFVEVDSRGGWSSISAGRFHSCLYSIERGLWCSGQNKAFQLGVDVGERIRMWVQVLPPT